MFDKCKILDIPSFNNSEGCLSVVESPSLIPFNIERIYYLHKVPKNTKRGVHAHKKLEQLIIAISGSFDITIDDGNNRQLIHMNTSTQGLYICPMIWREIDNFSSDAVLMVLASTKYDPDDYIHEYEEFLHYKNQES